MSRTGCRGGGRCGVGRWLRSRPLQAIRTPVSRAPKGGILLSRRIGSHLATSKPVPPALLQEAIAKAARRTVQSERPGLAAGAFAFGAMRTRLCGKRSRAWRSLAVGQRRGAARDRPLRRAGDRREGDVDRGAPPHREARRADRAAAAAGSSASRIARGGRACLPGAEEPASRDRRAGRVRMEGVETAPLRGAAEEAGVRS